MPHAAAQAVDVGVFPTAERISKGDIVVTGKGRAARSRALHVIERLDRDCQMAAAWLLAKTEQAQYTAWRCQRFERCGDGGTAELLPSERAEAARRALHRMWKRLPADQAQVVEYRLCFDECEADVAVRLGLSRGQVSRRFAAGLKAVARVLKGGERRSGW